MENMPEDTHADLIAHLDNDIKTYTEQLATVEDLEKRQTEQLNATRSRITYIKSQLQFSLDSKAQLVKE